MPDFYTLGFTGWMVVSVSLAGWLLWCTKRPGLDRSNRDTERAARQMKGRAPYSGRRAEINASLRALENRAEYPRLRRALTHVEFR